MSLALEERPVVAEATGSGGGPARRAIFRWSWRLFRREWRQQVLVLALMVFAVAATGVGIALAYNGGQANDPVMGSANAVMTVSGSDRAEVAAARRIFGTVEEIDHQSIAIPGSLDTLDVRAQDPNGAFGRPTLRLLSGRYPNGPGEVALTRGAAATFAVKVGDPFVADGRTRRVVGLVENPLDLNDEFALVAPGQADPPAQVTILFHGTNAAVDSFRPTGGGVSIGRRSTLSKAAAAELVLVLETIGLLFVGLVAAAGFAVMAQRRLRALGMLGALGATDRQVRLAVVANGAVVGAVGAIAGAIVGLVVWTLLTPWFEHVVGHRIDRFHLPWWAIAASMLLAVATAVIAAWWPARSASRSSIVAALSGRPAPPKPAHRFAGAGALLLATGLGCLACAHRNENAPNAFLIIAGTVATTFGMLFLGPLFIRALAVVGRRAPIALRLALRDLARYQARSAAALGAISLALAIAATVAISAAATAVPPAQANLGANQVMVSVDTGNGNGPGFGDGPGAIRPLSAAELRALQPHVDALAASLHAQTVIPISEAVDPASPTVSSGGIVADATATLGTVRSVTRGGRHGVEIGNEIPLYVATPALLRQYGIDPSAVDANADVVTGRRDLSGYVVIAPRGGPAAPRNGPDQWKPTVQIMKLPTYTSAPDTLLTAHALQRFGLTEEAAGWLMQSRSPLTTSDIDAARHVAAAAGLTIETRKRPASQAGLRDGATAVGLVVALGVLAMTVGLIRSETANELRTLAATGATSITRRTITGATAGALGFLGALLGTCGAYLALVAWHRSDLHPLTRVPYLDLVVIVVGLPVLAVTAGWILAGREPPSIAHQPLE